MLPARVQVDVDLGADDGHRLGAGRAHRHERAAEPLGDELGLDAGRVRETTTRGGRSTGGAGGGAGSL